MKSFLFSLMSVFFLVSHLGAHALSPSVGLVDVQNAILQTNEGKTQREKIEKEFTEKRQNLENQEKQLKKMTDDFMVQQSILSDADKQAKQKEFQVKLQQFQQDQVKYEQEAKQKEMTALQAIFQNMQKVIQKIAEEEKLDIVVDMSAGVFLYAANPRNITDKVVKMYNDDFKLPKK